MSYQSDRARRARNLSEIGSTHRTGRSAALFLAASAMLFSACLGSGRSAEAYCSSFEDSAIQMRDKYTERAQSLSSIDDGLMGVLIAFGSVVEAQGDLVLMFDKLETKAPDEIRTETAAVRDSLKSQLDSAGKSVDASIQDPLNPASPFAGLGSSLVSGLSNMGAYNNVNSYIQDNCDLSSLTGS